MRLTKAEKAQINASKNEIEDELELYKQRLIDTMLQIGVDPVPYDIAIRMTAETLRERDRAYRDYLKCEESRTTVQSWNSQARACLSMLKLTPFRVIDGDSESVV